MPAESLLLKSRPRRNCSAGPGWESYPRTLGLFSAYREIPSPSSRNLPEFHERIALGLVLLISRLPSGVEEELERFYCEGGYVKRLSEAPKHVRGIGSSSSDRTNYDGEEETLKKPGGIKVCLWQWHTCYEQMDERKGRRISGNRD